MARVRICVVGAKATGGLLATRLALSCNVMRARARGDSLETIGRKGLATGERREQPRRGRGAVVVLEGTPAPTETKLREYLHWHLAAFKVPRTIVPSEEIPKGATGNVQRVGTVQRLGRTPPS